MDRRTALISAASIAGVVLAGATAVGANIGILDRADNSGLGELSAATQPAVGIETQPATPVAVAASPTPDDTSAVSFIAGDAGVVAIETTDDGLEVAGIDTNPGWTATETDTDDGTIAVRFESDDATYEFVAVLQPDGTIEAHVNQPIVGIAPAPAPATDDDQYDDDQYDDDQYDDDQYDDDDHEDDHEDDDDDHEDDDDDHEDDHEDDDHDEYEGGDDDD